MSKTVFNEEFVAAPTGVEYHTQMESMRNTLSLMEQQHDAALDLLREVIEVIEVDDADDFEEVLTKVKEFVETVPFVDSY